MKTSIWIAATAAALVLAPAGWATTSSLVTIPTNGNLTAYPGETVGWGFTLTNDGSDYIQVTGSSFNQDSGPGIGFYTDFIGPQAQMFPPVGPGNTPWTQTFDNTLMTGLGSFAINAAAPVGSVITGTIEVSYDLYFDMAENDPESFGNILVSNEVEIEVVPEPATFGMAGGALLLLAGFIRRRRTSPLLNSSL